MPLVNPRAITLLVAFSTLISNVISSILLYQLPDDQFHLAGYGGWYLHFAGVGSVFGIISALRQHGPSIALFANYLLFDTLLCALPRFLLPLLLQQFSSTFCSPEFLLPAIQNPYVKAQHSVLSSSTSSSSSFSTSSPSQSSAYTISIPQSGSAGSWISLWSTGGVECESMLRLAQITLVAGALVATVLQFVGALCVRQYAKVLWLRELMEEGCGVDLVVGAVESRQESRRLDIIFEEKV